MDLLQRLLLHVYSVLLKCYPPAFSNIFAHEMRVIFGHLLTEARRKSHCALTLFIIREIVGLLIGIVRENVMTFMVSDRVRLIIGACIICLVLAVNTTISNWFIPLSLPGSVITSTLWLATGVSLVGLLYVLLSFRYGPPYAVIAVLVFGLPVMSAVLQALWLSFMIPLIVLLALFLYSQHSERKYSA